MKETVVGFPSRPKRTIADLAVFTLAPEEQLPVLTMQALEGVFATLFGKGDYADRMARSVFKEFAHYGYVLVACEPYPLDPPSGDKDA